MEDRQEHLNALVQSYLSTMADLGAETWLMHGTLMGWWWNRKVRLELTFLCCHPMLTFMSHHRAFVSLSTLFGSCSAER